MPLPRTHATSARPSQRGGSHWRFCLDTPAATLSKDYALALRFSISLPLYNNNNNNTTQQRVGERRMGLSRMEAVPSCCGGIPLENIDEEGEEGGGGMMAYPPVETPKESMEFLARSWTIPALELSRALQKATIFPKDDSANNNVDSSSLVTNPLTSQLVMDRILSQSETSPLTSGRLSQSSGSLNAQGNGSVCGSPPASPLETEDVQTLMLLHDALNPDLCHGAKRFSRSFSAIKPLPLRGKTMGRWLKEKKEKKKEEKRVHNAQVHAATSVAGVAAAVAAIAAASAAAAGNGNEGHSRTNMALASAATLVAAQCAEMAENMGADHGHLTSMVNSAVNVKTPGDIMTLTAGAATALRGATTLKGRTQKELWNNASVIPYDKGGNQASEYLVAKGDKTGVCSQDVLTRGGELLKRTRKGVLHWKLVYVYVKHGQVMVKLKSKHMGGTFVKKRKNVVYDIYKNIPAWPGRNLLEGGECKRYFGLNTDRGVIQFECKNDREHLAWTEGITKLLSSIHQHKL